MPAGGGAVVWAHQTQRSDDGVLHDVDRAVLDPTYAFTSERPDLSWGAADSVRATPGDVATVRIRATSGNGKPLFVGIAPAELDRYLSGVAHDEIAGIDRSPFAVEYARTTGTAAPSPPGEAGFWAVQGPAVARRLSRGSSTRGRGPRSP